MAARSGMGCRRIVRRAPLLSGVVAGDVSGWLAAGRVSRRRSGTGGVCPWCLRDGDGGAGAGYRGCLMGSMSYSMMNSRSARVFSGGCRFRFRVPQGMARQMARSSRVG